MGLHLVVNSSSTVLSDTLTLEGDPGVSEYLSEYIFMYIVFDRCYQYAAYELQAPAV
jgi:hypothetical protein